MELQDRCRGALVGLAAGNLLGIPCEGWEQEEIRRRWPNGIRDIEAEPGYPDDDDLAQAIILAEACVGVEALNTADLTQQFWVWAEESGFGIGNATYQSLTYYGGAAPRLHVQEQLMALARGLELSAFRTAREPMGLPALEASRAAWEESGRNASGNGAVMRCAPVAIRWRHDDAELVRNTAASAAVTHWDPRCVWSAVFVNLAIVSLLWKQPVDLSRLVERAEQAREALGSALAPFGIDAPVPAKVTEALAAVAAPAALNLDDWDRGYTLKAMQVALWCACRAADFEEALIAVVSAGGDTDTNGAVAGAVLGARFGLGAIPERWRRRVAELRPDREAIEVWADRLMM